MWSHVVHVPCIQMVPKLGSLRPNIWRSNAIKWVIKTRSFVSCCEIWSIKNCQRLLERNRLTDNGLVSKSLFGTTCTERSGPCMVRTSTHVSKGDVSNMFGAWLVFIRRRVTSSRIWQRLWSCEQKKGRVGKATKITRRLMGPWPGWFPITKWYWCSVSVKWVYQIPHKPKQLGTSTST